MYTHQLDDLDEHPVVGGAGHELEEGGGQREVVVRVLTGQLTDHTHSSRLDACNCTVRVCKTEDSSLRKHNLSTFTSLLRKQHTVKFALC